MSRNAIGEISGREISNEKVLVSAHIDSWDVGTGTMDDGKHEDENVHCITNDSSRILILTIFILVHDRIGGGVIITMLAMELMKFLNLKPRRTLSAVLWTGEEVGLVGASAYLNAHKHELANISVLLESDAATFRPLGLGFAGSSYAGCIIKEVSKLLKPLNASDYQTFEKISSDVDVFIPHGVPAISLRTDLSRRYWYHHTEADTLTVEDSEELDLCLAVWTISAYVLADLSITLPKQTAKTDMNGNFLIN